MFSHAHTLKDVAEAYIIFTASLMPSHACVSDMAELSLSREGYSSYLRAPQDLSVRAGDDVVVKCSASSSEEPIYSWYKEVRKPWECAQWQCPRYTCHFSLCLLLFLCDLFIFCSLFSFCLGLV